MRSVRDPQARQALIARVRQLSPDRQRRWGRMEVGQMVAHVSDQLRMAVGEVGIQAVRGPFRFRPMRYLIVHLLPWPKGRAKAPPEAFTTSPTTLDADCRTLVALIERFAATPPEQLAPLHPLFGRMTSRDWDVLSYRHLDHHLRQFGV
ncbi:MAG: DUF1569 domain-containing protein [Longimicrobiales bacterium]